MASSISKKCLLLALLILSTYASLSTASRGLNEMSMKERHEKWMAEHGRVYKDAAEKAHRFKIFKANVEFIDSFNAAGKHKYRLGANQFADLTNEEFKATYNGFRSSKLNSLKEHGSFMYENFTEAPASMDWRMKGAVTQRAEGSSSVAVLLWVLLGTPERGSDLELVAAWLVLPLEEEPNLGKR